MEATGTAFHSSVYCFRSPDLSSRIRLASPHRSCSLFAGRIKECGSITVLKPFSVSSGKKFRVKASLRLAPIAAPLQLESPVGQFLTEILLSYPHLLAAAVHQQLEQLQTARDAEQTKDEPVHSRTDIDLYRRIAEVRAKERRCALEEILYALIVQKFVEAEVSLIPTIGQTPERYDKVDQWPPQDEKLEALHSSEALEMIRSHLDHILGHGMADSNDVAPISKVRLGQVYAASVMYGYFIKRVDQRFQLEKSVKTLLGSEDVEAEEGVVKQTMHDESDQVGSSHNDFSSSSFSMGSFGQWINKAGRLRSYVMLLDLETLQRYATIRSKEAFNIIGKHTEALFGRPDAAAAIITPQPQGVMSGYSSKDDAHIRISFGGLRNLILEAITFGSFLLDVESYVDFIYPL